MELKLTENEIKFCILMLEPYLCFAQSPWLLWNHACVSVNTPLCKEKPVCTFYFVKITFKTILTISILKSQTSDSYSMTLQNPYTMKQYSDIILL